MLVSPNQQSSAGTIGSTEHETQLSTPQVGVPRAEQIVQRISAIAAALDALESDLSGCDESFVGLEEMFDRVRDQRHQCVSGIVEPAEAVACDESIESVRHSLDELLQRFERDIPRSLDRSANATEGHQGERSFESAPRDMLLDDVLSDVEPLQERADAAIEKHCDLTDQMTHQLARLVLVSQGLTSRAADLDAQAQDLTSQWDRLEHTREELSLERERLSHERFELLLRREAIDAETADLQHAYASLSERMSEIERSSNSGDESCTAPASPSTGAVEASCDSVAASADQAEPVQLVSEYVWSDRTPVADRAGHCDSADRSIAEQFEAKQLHAERQKLREFVEAFDAVDAEVESDAESVAIGVGSTLMLAENNTQNARRSREEAIRQLDEMLLSYASADAPSVAPVASTTTSHSTAPMDESTFDFESGDSLFGMPEPTFESELTVDEPASIIHMLGSELAADEAEEGITAEAISTIAEIPPLVTPLEEASIPQATIQAVSAELQTYAPIQALSFASEQSHEDEPVDDVAAAVIDADEDTVDLDQRSDSPSALFQSVESAVVSASVASTEQLTASAGDTDKVANLRSQLAEMFGIDSLKEVSENADSVPQEKPSLPLFSSGNSSEDDDDATEQTSIESHSEPESTGSLLREVLKAESTPVVENSEQNEPAKSAEEDPIKAYMEQLIARNRQQSGKSEPVVVQAPPFGRTGTVSAIEQDSSDSSKVLTAEETRKSAADDLSWLSESPKHKQDKESVRAHMKTLREVANQSARTAVVRSNKRQLKLQVVTKTVATVMSLIFGVTALIVELPVIYGYSVIGLGLLFAADLLIVIVRNWIALSNRSKLRKRNEDEQPLEVKADPRTEGRLATFARAEQSVTKS